MLIFILTPSKFVYPNVPTLGTNFVKADHVTLTHLYSKFIFAQAKSEVRNSRVSEIKDQLIVFCFEKASLQSLEFMYDMIKQLNLQDAQEYIFYLQLSTISAIAVSSVYPTERKEANRSFASGID